MILVYVDNKRFGEVSDLPFEGRVAYRNPRYFDKAEKCDGVYIHGDYPNIEKAYKGRLITFEETTNKDSKSTDYTIAELRDMKPDVQDWESFIEGDERKSVSQI